MSSLPQSKCYHVVLACHSDTRSSQWYDGVVARLAAADQFGLIRRVERALTGFVPQAKDCFTLEGGGSPPNPDGELNELPQSRLQERARSAGVNDAELRAAIDLLRSAEMINSSIIGLIQERQVLQKLVGVLLSFGRPIIRHSASSSSSSSVGSAAAHKLAMAVSTCTDRHPVAHQRWDEMEKTVLRRAPSEQGGEEKGEEENEDGSLLLLVLDRSDDPITPLLAPLTCQAMIHDSVLVESKTTRATSGHRTLTAVGAST
eukprot:COSAG06_NODE_2655_length_6487_cov_123.824515_6_plen_260_part_00